MTGPDDALRRPVAAEQETLSPWDDFPVHQSAALLSSVTPDRPAWSERFYFNVMHPTGEVAAILGGGVYPQRGVSETYFCRLDGDRQLNVRAFTPLPMPGQEVVQGPFTLRCDEPLRDWTVRVEVDDVHFAGRFRGINAPYLYEPIDVPATEPGGDLDLYRHFVATGSWDFQETAGLDISGEPLGVRDRTWGVRSRRIRWHNWCVFQLGDRMLALIHQELGDGTIMHSEAGVVTADGRSQRLKIADHDVSYDPHDRQVTRAWWDLDGEDGRVRLAYERVGLAMRLAGAGYVDTQGEGSAEAVQRDEYDLGDPEVARKTGRGTMDQGVRTQVTGAWEAEGIGVVESAIARNHVRYGDQVA